LLSIPESCHPGLSRWAKLEDQSGAKLEYRTHLWKCLDLLPYPAGATRICIYDSLHIHDTTYSVLLDVCSSARTEAERLIDRYLDVGRIHHTVIIEIAGRY